MTLKGFPALKNKKGKSLLNKIDYTSLWYDKWQMRNSKTTGACQKTITKHRQYERVTIIETAQFLLSTRLAL